MSPVDDLFRESASPFVLGTLSPDERDAFVNHLATCDDCAAEVRLLRGVVDAIGTGVLIVEPDASLRERVLRAAAEARRPDRPLAARTAATSEDGTGRGSSTLAWLAAAASLALAAGLGFYTAGLRTQFQDVQVRLASVEAELRGAEQRLAASQNEVTATNASLALLSASDTVELRFAGQTPAPASRGRAFLSRSRGLLVAASSLPSLPDARIYQLWYLTTGAPVSAGLLRPDAAGNVVARFDTAAAPTAATGLAVSLEPEGGSPAPTGAIYLVTQ